MRKKGNIGLLKTWSLSYVKSWKCHWLQWKKYSSLTICRIKLLLVVSIFYSVKWRTYLPNFSAHYPANICLDEDVLKTSFVFVFRKRLQDVVVKTNIFVLAIRLQDDFQTFSRRLQDVLQKRLQDIFKTSSRRFEDIFKTSWKDIFKTFSRSIIKLNCSC